MIAFWDTLTVLVRWIDGDDQNTLESALDSAYRSDSQGCGRSLLRTKGRENPRKRLVEPLEGLGLGGRVSTSQPTVY